MDEADAEEAALATLREELVVARGAVPPGEHARRIEALRGRMASNDGDERFASRMKIMGALHDLVKAMVFSRRSRLIGIELADDAFVVVHPFGKGITAGYLANHD